VKDAAATGHLIALDLSTQGIRFDRRSARQLLLLVCLGDCTEDDPSERVQRQMEKFERNRQLEFTKAGFQFRIEISTEMRAVELLERLQVGQRRTCDEDEQKKSISLQQKRSTADLAIRTAGTNKRAARFNLEISAVRQSSGQPGNPAF
jgi:hypothetical protein